jgi:predicted enzyme related to lactoylglutathione lyase
MTGRPGVCWVDLGVSDVPAAVSFYSGLFGWDVAAPDPTGYRLAGLEGQPVAAFGPAEDPGPPYWTVYVHTHDVVARVAAVTAAGGTVVVPPTPAGDAGIAATVRDPFGAPLSLWQPGTHRGTRLPGPAGTLAGVELRTDRIGGVARFLQDALQWTVHRGGTITRDGEPVATWSPAVPRPGSPWLVRFHVADLAAAMERATALGACVNGAAVLTDPCGARFALTGP